ncbi:MAG TPA: M67 family metallopeptidase [Geobacteraceae bacterium]|nr:M67 family metallopeptidase [Geobacteraceae bacterium]
MLRLPRKIGDAVIAHANEGFPLEVCGILGGIDGAVSSFHRMTNTNQSNEHFMMDPREQFAVTKELRAKGLEMLAIYHSHPESPARPSTEDIRLALTPDVSHVIVSLKEPDNPVLKSFRIAAGRVEPEDVEYL